MDSFDQNASNELRHRIWPRLVLFIGAPVGFVLLAMLFMWPFMVRFVMEPYSSPSASMVPTLQVGDHFFASKTIERDALRRGDVIVFRVPAKDSDYVKRLVGLPGDSIQMQGGVLYLNGAPVARQPAGDFGDPGGRILARYHELLPDDRTHDIVEMGDNSMLDDTQIFVVPPGHLFVMGDNRDNSLDSRTPQERGGVGFVPIENAIGRVTFIYWSDDPGRIGTWVE